MEVHKIRPWHTKTAPEFSKILPDIAILLKNKTIVAHNKAFDFKVLEDSIIDCGFTLNKLNIKPKIEWECTLKIYRDKGIKPCTLKDCCELYGIPLNHHDAISDTIACAKLYMNHIQNKPILFPQN